MESPNLEDLHLNQAQLNEELARRLFKGNLCLDWVVTLAFYSALHYINYKESLPDNHEDTLKWISVEIGDFIYHRYRYLFDKSRHARYRPQMAERYRKKSDETASNSLRKLKEIRCYLGVSTNSS